MVETRFDKIVVRSKLPTPFASAEAFGAGAGRALQRTGAVMANVADKALVEIDRQKQKDAVNKGMQFENSFDKLRREKVNSDYLTRKGQAALGTTAAWEKDAEEWYNQQKELVTNDYDQKILDEIYRRRNGATLDTLMPCLRFMTRTTIKLTAFMKINSAPASARGLFIRRGQWTGAVLMLKPGI